MGELEGIAKNEKKREGERERERERERKKERRVGKGDAQHIRKRQT